MRVKVWCIDPDPSFVVHNCRWVSGCMVFEPANPKESDADIYLGTRRVNVVRTEGGGFAIEVYDSRPRSGQAEEVWDCLDTNC